MSIWAICMFNDTSMGDKKKLERVGARRVQNDYCSRKRKWEPGVREQYGTYRIGQVEGVRPDHLEYLHHMDTLGAHVRLVVS
jgi:hypothetical protein